MNIRDDLKAYVDGELPLQRMEEIRKAVDADPKLRAELEFLEALSLAVSEEAADFQPSGAEKTLAAVRKGRTGLFTRRIWVLASAACAVLVVAMVPLLINPSSAELSEGAAPKLVTYAADDAGAPTEAAEQFSSDGALSNGAGGFERDQFSVEAKFKDTAKRQSPATRGIPVPQAVMQVADIELLVADASEAMDRAKELAKVAGGKVEASSLNKERIPSPVAMMTLRVPDEQFDAVVGQLQTMGTTLNVKTDSKDVNQLLADTDARLQVLQEDQQFRAGNGRGGVKGETEVARKRREQIAHEYAFLQLRQQALKSDKKLATITATFRQEPRTPTKVKKTSWHTRAWGGALASLSQLGRTAGQVGIYALVFTPVWAPVALGVWWVGKKKL